MPTRIDTMKWIMDCGMAAVIRAKSSDSLMQVAEAIKEGGIDVIEVTMTDNAFDPEELTRILPLQILF